MSDDLVVRVQIQALTASLLLTGEASDEVGVLDVQAHFAGDD